MKEYQIEHIILLYLSKKGYFSWKNPTVGYMDKKTGRWRKHKSRFAINGVSDIIAIKNGRVSFLEVKTPKGRQSDSQKEFEANMKLSGGNYFVVRSVEDVEELIQSDKI